MNTVKIRVRDDGGEWSEPTEVTIGYKTMRGHVAMLHRLGMYHTRQWELSVKSDGPVVIIGAEENLDVL